MGREYLPDYYETYEFTIGIDTVLKYTSNNCPVTALVSIEAH